MSSKPTLKIVASFDIPYLQYLDENSEPTQAFPDFADDETLLTLYRKMALVRMVDNKAVKLQRTGKMGTFPSSQGQEAIGVGVGTAMKAEDVYCPYYRETATQLQRGIKIDEIYSVWGGDERGNNYEGPREDLSKCVPIATQCLHATGVAFALQYRKEPRVAVTGIGEGGTSKGDFYEAINLAGAWNLPVVFIVNNNQWAISVPRSIQSAAKTFAQKAIAAGIQGVQVDGNDVIAVRDAVSSCIERARRGEGPALIEAISYRLCDHTTADDANRYQPPEEVKQAWKNEPIARLAYYLESKGLWSKEQEAALQAELTQEVETAVQTYLNKPKDKPQAMFDHLYAELPEAYLDQYDEVRGKG